MLQMSISSAGCGTNKVCLSKPANCDPAADPNCYFLSVIASPNLTEFTVELQGRASGYISFGFSDDQRMGNDDIYICGTDNNGNVQVQHAFSPGQTKPTILPLGDVSDITTSMMDGVINCSFVSQNPISTTRASGQTSTYFLLFAYGPSSNGVIRFHQDNEFVSSSKVDIVNPQTVSSAQQPQTIKAHGALMLIAWMTTASVGMMTARYLKVVTKGRGCCGKDLWFLEHMSLMSLSVVLTIVAFIVVFAYVQGWSGGAHPVLGCIVMILSLIQPVAASFRCAPQHERRYLFNWLHAINAVVIKVLADEDHSVNELVGTEMILLILFFLGNLAFLVALLSGIGMG
ncbi:hypothetical protein NFI96_002827 [Prochilodus magdalenae]|nr:hypothetical protein NFI96_002827 [Prochilodus magdalenae]